MPMVFRLQKGEDHTTEDVAVARHWATIYAEMERCRQDLNFEVDPDRVSWHRRHETVPARRAHRVMAEETLVTPTQGQHY